MAKEKSYGWMGIDMPRSVALRIAMIQRAIAKEDLYDEDGFGLEKHPHVTLAYGHEEDDPRSTKEAIKEILQGQGTVGGLSHFDQGDYKVLKFDVDSPDLHALNKAVKAGVRMPGETFKTYRPHVTVAYLKKDVDPAKYAPLANFVSGRKFPISAIRWSNPADRYSTILLPRMLREAVHKTAAVRAVLRKRAAEPEKQTVDVKNEYRKIYGDKLAENLRQASAYAGKKTFPWSDPRLPVNQAAYIDKGVKLPLQKAKWDDRFEQPAFRPGNPKASTTLGFIRLPDKPHTVEDDSANAGVRKGETMEPEQVKMHELAHATTGQTTDDQRKLKRAVSSEIDTPLIQTQKKLDELTGDMYDEANWAYNRRRDEFDKSPEDFKTYSEYQAAEDEFTKAERAKKDAAWKEYRKHAWDWGPFPSPHAYPVERSTEAIPPLSALQQHMFRTTGSRMLKPEHYDEWLKNYSGLGEKELEDKMQKDNLNLEIKRLLRYRMEMPDETRERYDKFNRRWLPGIVRNQPAAMPKTAALLALRKHAAKVTEGIAKGQDMELQPTEAQIKAENYKKAHVTIDGLDISIENPFKSVRSGVDDDGNEWSQTMWDDYGYIRGSRGYDKDHLDVFINPGIPHDETIWDAESVYVINQLDADGKFDEHKCMIGYVTKQQAVQAYRQNYEDGWDRAGAVVELPWAEFKEWAMSDGPTKGELKPLAKQAATRTYLMDIRAIDREIRLKQRLADPRLRKIAKIVLDIEMGDTVLVGRFKNKPVKVESIGTDENGQPTINGRKLLALRIKKLLPNGGPVAATTSAKAKQLKKQAATYDPAKEWIGVDLDGTLARYTEWKGRGHIGAPIKPMVDRVKAWLADGKKVKILTARASGDDGKARYHIDKWCMAHIGQVLPITCVKDMYCTAIYDDKARGVTKNTGKIKTMVNRPAGK